MKRSTLLSLLQCLILFLSLSFAGCSGKKEEGKGGAEPQQTVADGLKFGVTGVTPFLAKSRVLAAISDDEKPVAMVTANVGHEKTPAVAGAVPNYEIVFNQQGNAVAYKVGKAGKAAAVFNGKIGQLWKDIGAMAISPDGRRFAYTAMDDDAIWHLITSDSTEEVKFHHLGEPVFSPDSRHLAYQASANEDWYIAIDNIQSKGGKFSYDKPQFSADSSKIAYMENLDNGLKKLYIADLKLKNLRIVDSVTSQALISPDGKQMAAVVSKNDKMRLIRINFDQPDVVSESGEHNSISNIAFGTDGKSIAFVIERGGAQHMVLDGGEERLEFTPAKLPVINPSRKEVATVVLTSKGMKLHFVFSKKRDNGKSYDDISGIKFSKDGTQHAYAASKGKTGCIVVNGVEGPQFDKVVEPIFSPDGSRLVYRARKDGKRFVVVADSQGKTLRQHPAYEQVFQPVFSPDGKSVAYGVQDGKKLVWMVEKL